MSKRQIHQFSTEEKQKMIGDFYQILDHLKHKDDVGNFLMGLLTSSEALMLARRVQIAQMLSDGKQYREIADELSVGTETVASVASWLAASDAKYKSYIDRKKKPKKDMAYYHKDYIENLLDRYPGHRFLRQIFSNDR